MKEIRSREVANLLLFINQGHMERVCSYCSRFIGQDEKEEGVGRGRREEVRE